MLPLKDYLTQAANVVAVGGAAGYQSQSKGAVAVGYFTGYGNQGANAVAVGSSAGKETQGKYAIAVGNNSGKTSQRANAIAIGNKAGSEYQGACSIAIGVASGLSNQSANSIAIGTNAGNVSQSSNSIAIGTNAGLANQSANSIAIGTNAGNTNQGANSIAIGSGATAASQAAGSIVLNANSQPINAANVGFYVDPIRYDYNSGSNWWTSSTIYYNPSTNELTYGQGIGTYTTPRSYGLVPTGSPVILGDISAEVSAFNKLVITLLSGSWLATGWSETFTGSATVTQWGNVPIVAGGVMSDAMPAQGNGCTLVFSNQTPLAAEMYQVTVMNVTPRWNICIQRLV